MKRQKFHYYDKDLNHLPVPRLELRWKYKGGENWVCNYCLVYKHTLGNIVFVPMGKTEITTGTEGYPVRGGFHDLPFREGVHITNDSDQLNLPAFAVSATLITTIGKDCEQTVYAAPLSA
jgi:hypothetical protein